MDVIHDVAKFMPLRVIKILLFALLIFVSVVSVIFVLPTPERPTYDADYSEKRIKELIQTWNRTMKDRPPKEDLTYGMVTPAHRRPAIINSDLQQDTGPDFGAAPGPVKEAHICTNHDYTGSEKGHQMSRHINIYNIRQIAPWDYKCVNLAIRTSAKICLYDTKKDVYVSSVLDSIGMWESHIVNLFQNVLRKFPAAGVLDLGANLGVYSLVAAAMGRKIIAVEPNMETIQHFHKAVKINRLDKNITLLHNAVSNKRGCADIKVTGKNHADTRVREKDTNHIYIMPKNYTNSYRNSSLLKLKELPLKPCSGSQARLILMDDILPLIQADTLIVKLDIQGFEHRALAEACQFLDNINVPYIFMEWAVLRELYVSKTWDSTEKRLVIKIVAYLVSKGYQPRCVSTGVHLETPYWFGWPEDVLWESKKVKPLKNTLFSKSRT